MVRLKPREALTLVESKPCSNGAIASSSAAQAIVGIGRGYLISFAPGWSRRYGVSILNYVATSNHVHLLVADQGNQEIPRAMQLIAARTAQEFNTRKKRKGAFWEGRYHATAVQTDEHFLQCMTYIDLNMVRAGVVRHPCDWDVCGYNEIQSPWSRKGVIDFCRLKDYLDVASVGDLAILQKYVDESD